MFEYTSSIGMVFQNPDNQFVGATVEDDVAFGLKNQGLFSSRNEKRVEEALALVGMLDFKRESQRVYRVAKATCGHCRCCSPKTSDSNPR